MAAEPHWRISGSAAEKYERFVAPWFAPWAADLVARAELLPGSKVLDIACGTGIVARAAASALGSHGSIVGCDVSQDMLTEASKQAPTGLDVRWLQCDATHLPFEADAFDVIFCQQGLQFVEDKGRAVAEMARVLRPAGQALLGIWRSLEHNPYTAALSDGLTRHLSADAGQAMAAPCSFGDEQEIETLFREAGFTEVTVEAVERMRDPVLAKEAIEGNLASIPISDEIEAMHADAYQALIADIATRLSPHTQNGVLNVPMSSHVIRARP